MYFYQFFLHGIQFVCLERVFGPDQPLNEWIH